MICGWALDRLQESWSSPRCAPGQSLPRTEKYLTGTAKKLALVVANLFIKTPFVSQCAGCGDDCTSSVPFLKKVLNCFTISTVAEPSARAYPRVKDPAGGTQLPAGDEGSSRVETVLEHRDFDVLFEMLGHTFFRQDLLLQAFCHASYVNEQQSRGLDNNERLEFLGDAVLDLAVSHLLMNRFPAAEEGTLSKYRAMIVEEGTLAEVALSLGLGDYVLLGKGEEQSRGRQKPSILSNTLEALLGALYLDAGYEKTFHFVERHFAGLLQRVHSRDMAHDFKSMLQEYTQQTYKALPNYRTLEESGPAHDKTFRVALTLMGKTLAVGEGKTKKEAEQRAAREALVWIKDV